MNKRNCSHLLGFAFTSGNEDIEGVDFIELELVFINLLVESGLVDDGVVTVDQVLLEFVGKDTFKGVALVGFRDL